MFPDMTKKKVPIVEGDNIIVFPPNLPSPI